MLELEIETGTLLVQSTDSPIQAASRRNAASAASSREPTLRSCVIVMARAKHDKSTHAAPHDDAVNPPSRRAGANQYEEEEPRRW